MSDPFVRFRRLRDDARLPIYASGGAAGLDLYAVESVTLPPRSIAIIPTGIAVEIPDGLEGQIRPRSGLCTHGVVAILGTIDADFRGELKIFLENRHATNAYEVRAGDRAAQLVIAPVTRVRVVDSSELTYTARGVGGLGSTGR